MAKRILVIEDELDLLEIVVSFLERNGYKVDIAQNGQQGLDALKSERPDLILLDIKMPVMDGFQFYRTIKGDDKYYEIPVLIISGRTDAEDIFEAIGGDQFLSKPVALRDLGPKVASLVAI